MTKLLQLILLVVVLISVTSQSTAEVSITITEPEDGVVLGACSDVDIKLDVNAEGETIKRVRLYYNGRQKTYLRNEPWEYTWKEILRGMYELTAKVETEEGTEVYSDPIRFKAGRVSAGEIIFNGGFDCGKTTNWTPTFHETATGEYVVYDDGYFDDLTYLAVEIENGSSESWHVQLSQTCPLDSGHVYEIYFLAAADDKKTISVGMQENQDPWATQVWTDVEIYDPDEYGPIEFTALRTDPTNQLRFNFGGNNIMAFLDDVQVIDRSASSVKSKELDWIEGVASECELFQAYPSPFNMNTAIKYSLSNPAVVDLSLYNMRGQKIRTLVSQAQVEGSHTVTWDGRDESASIVPSGVYLYRLQVEDDSKTTLLSRKVLLLK